MLREAEHDHSQSGSPAGTDSQGGPLAGTDSQGGPQAGTDSHGGHRPVVTAWSTPARDALTVCLSDNRQALQSERC